jgi:metal-responsive CopG/Arc/MetJ family transcriptional regulator
MSSIGIRVPDDLLEKLDHLSDEHGLDRSTVIRRLLRIGYEEFMLEEAADRYRRGDITISEAADHAECTVWELERYLVQEGYVSDYSIADLEREQDALRSVRES